MPRGRMQCPICGMRFRLMDAAVAHGLDHADEEWMNTGVTAWLGKPLREDLEFWQSLDHPKRLNRIDSAIVLHVQEVFGHYGRL